MTIDEFDPDDILVEISRKLSNVSIQTTGEIVDKNSLTTLRYYLNSDNIQNCYIGAHNLRKYLTQAKGPGHVDDLLELDVLPTIKRLLTYHEESDLQFECAWIVTNIAAGSSEHTNALVDADFIAALLDCLDSEKSTITAKAQAAWALSNFAGESPALRELLMTNNALEVVANVLNNICIDVLDDALERSYATGRVTIRNSVVCVDVKALTWALSNMCRGGFRTAEYWNMYLPTFHALAQSVIFDHKDIWIDACWGLSRILYNMHEVDSFYQFVNITPQLCSRLTQLLCERTVSILVPVLRCIINITSGPNEHSKLLLETSLLTNLSPLTSTDVPVSIRRDAFLVVANLAASDEELVHEVIQCHEIMESVIDHVHVPGHAYQEDSSQWFPTVSNAYYNMNDEWKITTEALWVLCNLANLASDEALCDMLAHHPQIPKSLAFLLNYTNMPLSTCVKGLDVIITIIGRTNKISQLRLTGQHATSSNAHTNNPYLQQFVEQAIPTLLPCLRKAHAACGVVRKRCMVLESLFEDDQQRQKGATAEAVVSTTLDNQTGHESAPTSNSSTAASSNLAAMFGLSTTSSFVTTGANKRRVLRGHEDGDIRLIENAVGNLCITETESNY